MDILLLILRFPGELPLEPCLNHSVVGNKLSLANYMAGISLFGNEILKKAVNYFYTVVFQMLL